MNALQPLQERLQLLDSKAFRNYMLAFFGILALAIGIILYRYYSVYSGLRKKINMINMQREAVKDILIRKTLVKQQQKDVEKLITEEPKFKIKEYFGTIIAQHNLQNKLVRPPEPRQTELETGHIERELIANFKNLNMQTVAELLDTLEVKPRIYTKSITLRQEPGRTVNLNLVIATLEPKPAEAAE